MGKLNKRLLIVLVILVVCSFFLMPLLYYGYNYRVNSRISLVKVPYANLTIQPDTKVNTAMVSIISVPESFLKGSYYKSIDDIVGKCVNNDTIIVEDSIFYDDLLVEC